MALLLKPTQVSARRPDRKCSVTCQAFCRPKYCSSRSYYKPRPLSFGFDVRMSDEMLKEVDSMFDGVFWDSKQSSRSDTRWFEVNVEKLDLSYQLLAEVPGLAKSDISVKVSKDNDLRIEFERKAPEDSEAESYNGFQQRRSGKYRRSIKLPKDAQVDQIKASVKNGILTVNIPRELSDSEQFVDVEIE